MRSVIQSGLITLAWSVAASLAQAPAAEFQPLFPRDGVPEGWSVRRWNDVALPADAGVVWTVRDGVLLGSEPRGTWLVSDKTYGDFILEFEWKLGERGNGGCGLRFPPRGDPAFDGLELQMVDPRYYGEAQAQIPATELTGSLYRALAPRTQLYRPLEWNHYRVTCRGGRVQVELNGQLTLDADLESQLRPTRRHDGTEAPPLKDRPRRGHLGFQELSRGGGRVEVRNARLMGLDEQP